MSMEHIVVTEIKRVFKKQTKDLTMMEVCQRHIQKPIERAPNGETAII